MRKYLTFPGLALVVLFLFACNMSLPQQMRIIGNPSLKFAANMNLGEEFSKMLESAFEDSGDDFMILEAVNAPQYVTLVIHMEVFNRDIKFTLGTPDPDEVFEIVLPNGDILVIKDFYDIGEIENAGVIVPRETEVISSNENEPVIMPLEGFEESLHGFNFDTSEFKSYIYISGTDIVQALTIDLDIGGEKETLTDLTSKASGITSANNNIYDGTDLPPGGISVNLSSIINAKSDVDIGYRIYLEEGKEVDLSWLDYAHVTIEIVIWLPIMLVAQEDGAILDLPDDLSNEISGLLEDIADMIKSVTLELVANMNPFAGGTLIIQNDGLENDIKRVLGLYSLVFELNEDIMDIVRDPDKHFAPKLSISFDPGGGIRLPKEFRIITVAVDASVDYTTDLPWNSSEED